MPYKKFELEDFLSDEKFQNWVLKGENDDFWSHWVLENPNKKSLIDEAVFIFKNIHLKKNKLEEKDIDLKWVQLKAEIEKEQLQRLPTFRSPVRKKTTLRTWMQRAAVIGFLLVATVAGYQFFTEKFSSTKAYATGYGEKMEVVLPDGSTVRINANSKITVPTNWDKTALREVKLDYGEAYFEVEKTPLAMNPKFVVNTQNMKVEVLGTAFNVNSRRKKTTVALAEGKVNLKTKSGLQKIMNPGDIVSFLVEDETLSNVLGDQSYYLSWLDNRIVLNNTSLLEIALIIEDHFGIKVEINDKALQQRALTGTFSDEDIDIIIRSIESSLDIKAVIKQNKIVFD